MHLFPDQLSALLNPVETITVMNVIMYLDSGETAKTNMVITFPRQQTRISNLRGTVLALADPAILAIIRN